MQIYVVQFLAVKNYGFFFRASGTYKSIVMTYESFRSSLENMVAVIFPDYHTRLILLCVDCVTEIMKLVMRHVGHRDTFFFFCTACKITIN